MPNSRKAEGTGGGSAPNVVLILLDQLRADVVGAYGGRVCRTPRIDALAAQGMRFDRAYTPIGICSPARASLFTGKYPHRHGVLNNVTGPDALQRDLLPDDSTVAELLAGAGYRTAYTGKWHVDKDDGPRSKGFADVLGGDASLAGDLAAHRARLGLDTGAPIWNMETFTRYPALSPRATREQYPFPIAGRELLPLEGTPQGYHLANAIELLDRAAAADRPFLLVLSFIGPHWPHVLPEPWWSMYPPSEMDPWPNFHDDFTGKPGANRRSLQHFGVEGWTWEDWQPVVAAYYGSVTMHDHLVGSFLDALDGRGLARETMVVVTVDHGDMTGAHRQFNKGPMMYEELYRIPMVVRWPGVVEAGADCSELVSSMDLMPTLLEAGGVTAPQGLDSRSLLPLLRGEPPADWRTDLVSEYHGDEFGLYSQRMLRTGDLKFVYNPHDTDELYDLAADPHELHNLARDPQRRELVDDLESRLCAWMQATEDPLGLWAFNFLG